MTYFYYKTYSHATNWSDSTLVADVPFQAIYAAYFKLAIVFYDLDKFYKIAHPTKGSVARYTISAKASWRLDAEI